MSLITDLSGIESIISLKHLSNLIVRLEGFIGINFSANFVLIDIALSLIFDGAEQ